ncbi:tetratricopeptide repeat protein [Urbifossiella limnaea]|uniref:Serine/threonine-protein kinase PknB n=1 Tax=Urbifossiella limnaea TaxID=2528023 RepID=A0A517Y1S0_9BACT|nr:tetratricopeptide repeat protein [Urbifossiella limnaea]QDU23699.1 Serine/threonine-protein kinase PknB [Urbifossiella limnaea]
MPAESTVKIEVPVRPHPVPPPETPPPALPTWVMNPSVGPVDDAAGARLWIPGYEVGREIARGGMGLVLAARDPKLGRDVAVKVLLPGDCSGEAARRFVQESRITARLPHPAIPPVYELGTLPDGGPFLAMKFVRGRTLAAELKGADRPADLPRLVRVFEQVAQAVGFAHSQGVVHRDLKPANVMVGAFGEVQLMDWGLAKEVGGADDEPRPGAGRDRHRDDPVETEVGVALGTPAYMAPEQARGEPATPSIDVFALGGILCDVLTGHPPFAGGTAEDTVVRAARGDVEPAFARLDACGADADLVALCKHLLSPRAADRPADGEAVADAVAAYRAGVERRLREAEAERAAAGARAAEQRKKRRVQAALAVAVVAFAAVVGLGAWWQDRQAADRRRQDELRQLAERERLARDAAAVEDVLARCEDRLRQGDADRAEELLAQAGERVAQGAGDANGNITRLRAELALLRELDAGHDLEWAVVAGKPADADRLVAAWSGVFRRVGFAAGSPPSDETVARVRGATTREQLLRALESWFWTRPSAGVAALLLAADPDAYRNAVRAARREGNAARLVELAGAPEALGQPARFALLLARDPAVPVARRDQILDAVYRSQPNNFHVLMDLAASRPGGRADRTADRAGWYRAALAVRPRSVSAWNNLGNVLHDLGKFPAAITAYQQAIRIDPKFAIAFCNLGTTLRDAKDAPGALAALQAAVRLDPGYAHGHNNLGNALQDAGDLAGAVAAFREAIRLTPDYVEAYTNLASALCESGDPRAGVVAAAAAVRLDPTDAIAHSHLGNARRAAGDLPGATDAYNVAIRLDPRYAPVRSNLGHVLRDRGDVPGAVAAYREAVRIDPGFAAAHSYLGNALREAGDTPAATAACREAIRLDPAQAHAHHHLGLALKAAGDQPGAVAAYRDAIRTDPNYARAHNSLGLALRASGDLEGAVTAYRDAVRTDPKYVPAYNNLGIALKAAGDLPGALGAYKAAVRLEPGNVLANYNLGLALAATGDGPGAVAAFRQAVRTNPDLLPAHACLAELLRASGDVRGAVAAYREVIRLNPRHAPAHAALGLALAESGDAAAGRAAFAEAARLDPDQFGPPYRQRFLLPVAPPPRELTPRSPARDAHSLPCGGWRSRERRECEGDPGSHLRADPERASPGCVLGRAGYAGRMSDVTRLLDAAAAGDRAAAADLLPLVYDELRKLAAARMAAEPPDHTLPPTALVHEAYLRLVGPADAARWDDRGHFFAAAAEAMRRVLVNHASDNNRQKRGGGGRVRLELLDQAGSLAEDPGLVLSLDELLTRLGGEDATAAQVVTGGVRHTTSHGDELKVWDAKSGQALVTVKVNSSVLGVAFSPDGTRIATAHNNKTAAVRDAATGAALVELKGHTGGVTSVAFSPDGRRVVTGSMDHTVRVWDARTGTTLAELKSHTGAVTSVAFRADGRQLLTSARRTDGKPSEVMVWDAPTRAPGVELAGGSSIIMTAAFSPDGTRVATASQDGTVRLSDARTGSTLHELQGGKRERGEISLAFSADGARIASGGNQPTVKVWDARTGAELVEFQTGPHQRCAFSTDGTRIVTEGFDQASKVWDARSGQELKGEAVPRTVLCERTSPDGRYFVRHLQGRAEVLPLQPDPEDAAERRLQSQPNLARYRAGYLAARLARDEFAAAFYLKLVPPGEHKAVLDQADADGFAALETLAQEHLQTGKRDEAIPVLVELLAVSRTRHGPEDPATVQVMDELGRFYHQTGQAGKAILLLEDVVKIRKANQDPEAPHAMGMLGLAYKDTGRHKEAIAVLEEGAATDEGVRQQLLDVYAVAGEHAKVVTTCREQLEILRTAKDEDEVADSKADLLALLGRAYLAQKKWSDAEAPLRECGTIREKNWPNQWPTFETQSLLGEALLRQKKYAEAEPLLVKGYAGLKQREYFLDPREESRIPEALDRLIDFYTATDKPDDAARWRAERAKYPPPAAPPPREKM